MVQDSVSLTLSSQPMESFLLLAKSTKGAAAVQLVNQALSAPGVYVFAELLDCPNIKEMESSPSGKQHLAALNLFAFGVYKDYIAGKADYPALTDVQITKLRQLTIANLAAESKRIPYATLLEELGLDNVRKLEDLIIESIYANLVLGKLDQKNQYLEIENCMGRDVKDTDVESIVSTLTDWSDRCQVLLVSLEEQMMQANHQKVRSGDHEKDIDNQVLSLRKSLKLAGAAGTSGIDLEDGAPDVSSSSLMADDRKKEKRSKLSGLRGSAPKIWKQ